MNQKETSPRDPDRLDRARNRLSEHRAQAGMARLRKALCDPARMRIIQALADGEISVNDLALAIDRAPAATSQHLRVLRDLGLVSGSRKGTAVYYRLCSGAATSEIQNVLLTLGAP